VVNIWWYLKGLRPADRVSGPLFFSIQCKTQCCVSSMLPLAFSRHPYVWTLTASGRTDLGTCGVCGSMQSFWPTVAFST
jgi:hypothetical protein